MCPKFTPEELEENRKLFWHQEYHGKRSFIITGPMCFEKLHDMSEFSEVIEMCRLLITNICASDYLDAYFPSIDIYPFATPDYILETGLWSKEKRHVEKGGYCCISLPIDYDAFAAADPAEKKRLYLDNIYASLRVIRKRLGRKFDCERMFSDIKNLLKDDPDLAGYDEKARQNPV